MFKAVIILVRNIKSNRFHPAVLVNSQAMPTVFRSRMFHENGFKTQAEAVAHAKGDMKQAVLETLASEVYFWLDNPMDWDARGIPSIQQRFDWTEGKDGSGGTIQLIT